MNTLICEFFSIVDIIALPDLWLVESMNSETEIWGALDTDSLYRRSADYKLYMDLQLWGGQASLIPFLLCVEGLYCNPLFVQRSMVFYFWHFAIMLKNKLFLPLMDSITQVLS